MKDKFKKAGLLGGVAFSLLGIGTPVQSSQAGIAAVSENSPLYLDQAPIQNEGDVSILSWHYSHESHESHASHYSHRSGY